VKTYLREFTIDNQYSKLTLKGFTCRKSSNNRVINKFEWDVEFSCGKESAMHFYTHTNSRFGD